MLSGVMSGHSEEQPSSGRCVINIFSDDLLLLIFIYLSADDLFQVDRINVLWHQILRNNDQMLFYPLINLVYNDSSTPVSRLSLVQYNKPKEYNIFTRIQQLSLSQIKKSLVGIDLSRCIEKRDYQRMLFSKLLFHGMMEHMLASDDPRFRGKYLSQYYPDWSLVIPVYKGSYLFHRNDITRKQINTYELCKINWQGRFKNSAHQANLEQADMTWQIQFNEDLTMFSTIQGHEMNWKVSVCFSLWVLF
jgi:hypothetical protein